MNLCPSYIHLRAAKSKSRSKTKEENNDIFYPEIYPLLDDRKIAHITAVRAHTPYLVSIRMFVCQNKKDQEKNYCDKLMNPNADKKVCESNNTNYIFFYIDKSEHQRSENKPNEEPLYMVAFVLYSPDEDRISQEIVAEAKKTAEWLGIEGSVIQCYIFYYTRNTLCNTFDWGAFKKKYEEYSRDPKYYFHFQYFHHNDKPRWLNINGGSPKFEIKIKEM